jgi:hypothetical protein
MEIMKNSMVDLSALRFNQICIISLVLLGFVLNQPALPAGVALVLLAGSIMPELALFKLIYRHVMKPLGLMRPHTEKESPAPHEFAQMLGGTVLAFGSGILFSGHAVAGWSVAWCVVFLAAANLFFGFCAGCFVYYQLGRFGVPGFHPRSSEE